MNMRYSAQMERGLYQKNDKVMVLDTGEVLTVVADFSDRLDSGIIVTENLTRPLSHSEVRPAGRTREQLEAAGGIKELVNPPSHSAESPL